MLPPSIFKTRFKFEQSTTIKNLIILIRRVTKSCDLYTLEARISPKMVRFRFNSVVICFNKIKQSLKRTLKLKTELRNYIKNFIS